ncbi:ABC transporter ATP-binding protein [Sulfuracidifex metallicus]|uniref:ABC transporter ATP-binding protein n=1 Tax=Sulfuracidifex metallicus TaxID=47303 RepID=UPI0022761A31|nr:ABC transporter ATP-binding protein [Sulfuracidifex metallicus]MCY0850832.1 ABC transporter ATP-binding protein [Sulfuracidifex metallicus]
MLAIDMKDVWKTYKNGIQALKGLNLQVESGEIFSLLGPNGAGKTTTVKVMSCILKYDRGNVKVLGKELPDSCGEILREVGIMPQEFQGFTDLTVRENLEYFSKLYDKEVNIDSLIDTFELKKYENKKLRELSGGYKRRVGLASALAGDPKILFLDEPTVGLDPKARRSLWNIIKGLKEKGITVFLTTHYLDEAEKLSDTVVVIYDGKVVRRGKPGEIIDEFKKENLEDAYLELLKNLEGENNE